MNKVKRILKSREGLMKAMERNRKAKAERIWIESNPQIHILNYPFYKLWRELKFFGEAFFLKKVL